MTTSDTLRPVEAEATTDSLDLTTDVVIVGGGLAGLTLAAALATAGVPVICLDRDTPPTQMEQDFDGRTTALAFCSKQVRKRKRSEAPAGVPQQIPARHAISLNR